jgi:integrase
MKHPNGYGSVVKLSGNRRNPFAVRKTIGWNEKGHPIYEVIGYFPTRKAGLIALAEYNADPWDIDTAKITLEGLYKLWCEKKAPKAGTSTVKSMQTAYRHCSALHGARYADIRAVDMQECINARKSSSSQMQVKNLFWHLDRLALEYDISVKSYNVLLTTDPQPETPRVPFTDDEVAALWAKSADPWADTVLIFIYTGLRFVELLGMKKEDVDLQEGIMTGGVKTKAGKGRIIPIHSKILPLVEARYHSCESYLIENKGQNVSARIYRRHWRIVMDAIGAAHTPHDARHTLRTWLDDAKANAVCIDRILGHASKGTGERVYTHKTIQDLKNAMALVTR